MTSLSEYLNWIRERLFKTNRDTGFDSWVIHIVDGLDKLTPVHNGPFPDLPFNTSVGDEVRYFLVKHWNVFDDSERADLLYIADDIDRRYRAEEARHRETTQKMMHYYGRYYHYKPLYNSLVKSFKTLFNENKRLKEELTNVRSE